jgi:hypothetical protein
MLHDIWNYKVGENPEHGQLGAIEARKILDELGSFSPEEMDVICTAIAKHGDKGSIDSEMDELLKDADVFQHYLYEPDMFKESATRQAHADSTVKPMRLLRLERVLSELGMPISSEAGRKGNPQRHGRSSA